MLVAASFYLLLILRMLLAATMVTLPATHDLNRQARVFEVISRTRSDTGYQVVPCQVPGAHLHQV